MLKMMIIKRICNQKTGYRPVYEEFSINAENKEALFSMYFREFVNRHKYINEWSYSIKNRFLAHDYNIWISDINNYANNGGDMW